MKNQLVITALGEDRPGLVCALARAVLDCGCSLGDSRMTVLGGEFAMVMLVRGNWNTLVKLEGQLARLGQTLELTINHRRTERRRSQDDILPYAVEVIALDQPGILNNLSQFFAERAINIEEMATRSYPAPHTGTPMFSVNLIVGIPARIHIPLLREEFMDFCDDLNLDAVMEPVKG
ncbi:MAG: glycine cleavage system protein R [Candidatus Competibacteraceae bacterium]|nr:glycine cleavage system protein R [Candidatus Competibacteraceae bacterium]